MARKQDKIPAYQVGKTSGKVNRALEMRRDTDKVKIPAIKIYDIDYAILYHLSDSLKLKIRENRRSIDVPVIYADGERWTQIRARGYLRDNKRQLMSPLIALRRINVEVDDRLPILDLSAYVPQFKFYPYVSTAMKYDRRAGQIERQKVYDMYMVDLPNFVRVSYDIMIWTRQISQLNDIVQAIMATSNHMWGDTHTFRGVIDSSNLDIKTPSDSDRMVSATLPLLVDGRLQEEFEYHEPTMLKRHSIKKVLYLNEKEESDFYINESAASEAPEHISERSYQEQLRYGRKKIRFK